MNESPRKPQPLALRIIGIVLVLIIAAAILLGASQFLAAGLYLMSGNTEMALSELLQGASFLIGAYIVNLLTAFLFTRKWSWRGLQLLLVRPTDKK